MGAGSVDHERRRIAAPVPGERIECALGPGQQADPSDWLSHSSLMYAGKVSTPTLLMTGVLDPRTPMPPTEEYFAALKTRGVPVKLLQFEDEYHGTPSKPSDFIRTQLYMMSWFKKYTRSGDGKAVPVSASAGQ